MNECLRKRVVNRQLVVLLEPGKMHVCLQVESRKLRVESLSQRAITQEHEIPRRVPVVAGVGDPGPFQPVSIFRVSSDKPREILLWNKSRRCKKVILRQTVVVSDFGCSLPAIALAKISNFCSATRKV